MAKLSPLAVEFWRSLRLDPQWRPPGPALTTRFRAFISKAATTGAILLSAQLPDNNQSDVSICLVLCNCDSNFCRGARFRAVSSTIAVAFGDPISQQHPDAG